jgi:hypothetical protein
VQPTRVKLYGLFPVTRRRYLIQAAAVVVLAAVLLAAWLVAWYPTSQKPEMQRPPPQLALTVGFLNSLPWVLLALTAAQAVEAVVVLRAFARKDAAERAKPTVPKP